MRRASPDEFIAEAVDGEDELRVVRVGFEFHGAKVLDHSPGDNYDASLISQWLCTLHRASASLSTHLQPQTGMINKGPSFFASTLLSEQFKFL